MAEHTGADLQKNDLSITRSLRDGRMILIRRQPIKEAGWVATHEDITERRKAEEQLSLIAHPRRLAGRTAGPPRLPQAGQFPGALSQGCHAQLPVLVAISAPEPPICSASLVSSVPRGHAEQSGLNWILGVYPRPSDFLSVPREITGRASLACPGEHVTWSAGLESSLDWSAGLERPGLERSLDWSAGLERWTGALDWSAGLERWTGALDWSAELETLDRSAGLERWTGASGDWSSRDTER